MKRHESVKKASVLGIIFNLFLVIIKGLIGFITKSQSMIADFVNSFGDVFSSLMTFIGNKIASKPSDDDHNLGHGKAEYIYSMIISIIMIITSLVLFKDSILTIIYRKKFTFSKYLIVVCLVTILIKLGLYIYTNKISKEHKNILIKANSIDHRNDCIITSLNLFSCTMSYFGIFFFDGIIGILISTWLIYESVKIFLESYDVLIDRSIDIKTKNRVLDIINKHKEIVRINHFNSTPVGYKYQISFTIFVDGNLSTFKSHEIANKLEKEIDKEIEEIYLTVIHVNPI